MKRYIDQLPSNKPRASVGKLIDPWKMFSYDDGDVEVLCRERVAPIYLGDGQMLSRVLGRFKFLTDASDMGFAPHIIMDGYWEMWLTRWMVETVQAGWTAIDVGANYGYYAVLLAELIGPHGRLLAFEPNPACARATEFTLEINSFAGRSEVHEVALSNTSGRSSFFVPKNEPKNGHLLFGETPEAVVNNGEHGMRFTVPVATLDSIAEPLDRVDFVKIDAEGAEMSIFEGMKATIARHNPLVIMEFNSDRGEASAFAADLKQTYPDARYLEEGGKVQSLDHDRLKKDSLGKDWLLILQQ